MSQSDQIEHPYQEEEQELVNEVSETEINQSRAHLFSPDSSPPSPISSVSHPFSPSTSTSTSISISQIPSTPPLISTITPPYSPSSNSLLLETSSLEYVPNEQSPNSREVQKNESHTQSDSPLFPHLSLPLTSSLNNSIINQSVNQSFSLNISSDLSSTNFDSQSFTLPTDSTFSPISEAKNENEEDILTEAEISGYGMSHDENVIQNAQNPPVNDTINFPEAPLLSLNVDNNHLNYSNVSHNISSPAPLPDLHTHTNLQSEIHQYIHHPSQQPLQEFPLPNNQMKSPSQGPPQTYLNNLPHTFHQDSIQNLSGKFQFQPQIDQLQEKSNALQAQGQVSPPIYQINNNSYLSPPPSTLSFSTSTSPSSISSAPVFNPYSQFNPTVSSQYTQNQTLQGASQIQANLSSSTSSSLSPTIPPSLIPQISTSIGSGNQNYEELFKSFLAFMKFQEQQQQMSSISQQQQIHQPFSPHQIAQTSQSHINIQQMGQSQMNQPHFYQMNQPQHLNQNVPNQFLPQPHQNNSDLSSVNSRLIPQPYQSHNNYQYNSNPPISHGSQTSVNKLSQSSTPSANQFISSRSIANQRYNYLASDEVFNNTQNYLQDKETSYYEEKTSYESSTAAPFYQTDGEYYGSDNYNLEDNQFGEKNAYYYENEPYNEESTQYYQENSATATSDYQYYQENVDQYYEKYPEQYDHYQFENNQYQYDSSQNEQAQYEYDQTQYEDQAYEQYTEQYNEEYPEYSENTQQYYQGGEAEEEADQSSPEYFQAQESKIIYKDNYGAENETNGEENYYYEENTTPKEYTENPMHNHLKVWEKFFENVAIRAVAMARKEEEEKKKLDGVDEHDKSSMDILSDYEFENDQEDHEEEVDQNYSIDNFLSNSNNFILLDMKINFNTKYASNFFTFNKDKTSSPSASNLTNNKIFSKEVTELLLHDDEKWPRITSPARYQALIKTSQVHIANYKKHLVNLLIQYNIKKNRNFNTKFHHLYNKNKSKLSKNIFYLINLSLFAIIIQNDYENYERFLSIIEFNNKYLNNILSDSHGRNLFHYIAKYNSYNIYPHLYEFYDYFYENLPNLNQYQNEDEKNFLNICDENNRNCLFYSILDKNFELFTSLIGSNIDFTSQDAYGVTPQELIEAIDWKDGRDFLSKFFNPSPIHTESLFTEEEQINIDNNNLNESFVTINSEKTSPSDILATENRVKDEKIGHEIIRETEVNEISETKEMDKSEQEIERKEKRRIEMNDRELESIKNNVSENHEIERMKEIELEDELIKKEVQEEIEIKKEIHEEINQKKENLLGTPPTDHTFYDEVSTVNRMKSLLSVELATEINKDFQFKSHDTYNLERSSFINKNKSPSESEVSLSTSSSIALTEEEVTLEKKYNKDEDAEIEQENKNFNIKLKKINGNKFSIKFFLQNIIFFLNFFVGINHNYHYPNSYNNIADDLLLFLSNLFYKSLQNLSLSKNNSEDSSEESISVSSTLPPAPPKDTELLSFIQRSQEARSNLSPPRDIQLAIHQSKSNQSSPERDRITSLIQNNVDSPLALKSLSPPQLLSPPSRKKGDSIFISTAPSSPFLSSTNNNKDHYSSSPLTSNSRVATSSSSFSTTSSAGSINNYSLGHKHPPGVSWRYVQDL